MAYTYDPAGKGVRIYGQIEGRERIKCPQCKYVFYGSLAVCPRCGKKLEPRGRGDMYSLDSDTHQAAGE